jgi:hypothetical protein
MFTEPLPGNCMEIYTESLPSNNKGIFTEPLPSNDRWDTHAHRQQFDLISRFLFFQNKESRLKIIFIPKQEQIKHREGNYESSIIS